MGNIKPIITRIIITLSVLVAILFVSKHSYGQVVAIILDFVRYLDNLTPHVVSYSAFL
jgi:hypothetical protein